jgi:hypothetical protein
MHTTFYSFYRKNSFGLILNFFHYFEILPEIPKFFLKPQVQGATIHSIENQKLKGGCVLKAF